MVQTHLFREEKNKVEIIDDQPGQSVREKTELLLSAGYCQGGYNVMIGLKKGTVKLMPHQSEWNENAENTVRLLRQLLGDTAVDIAVALNDVNDILPFTEVLKEHNILFHEQDIADQRYFVMEHDDIRTHHIHIVKWKGTAWDNYINFRDYLNAYTEKAMMYDELKQSLAAQFPNDRRSYTAGKQKLIGRLLSEAAAWRLGAMNKQH